MHMGRVKGALQLRSKRYGQIHFAQVPERVLTMGFVEFRRFDG